MARRIICVTDYKYISSFIFQAREYLYKFSVESNHFYKVNHG